MYICKYAKYSNLFGKYLCPYREKMKPWERAVGRNLNEHIKVRILCPEDAKFSEDGTPICAIVKDKRED